MTSYEVADEGYVTDVDLVTNAIGTLGTYRVGIPSVNASYWLASRGHNGLNSISGDHVFINTIRDNEIKIASGDGSADHPYELGI